MGEEYYTVKRITNIIRDYHTNLRICQNVMQETLKSVGVSQYGVEASLPKGTGTSNAVERQALQNIENTKMIANKLTNIKYIQDRWDRVQDETDAIVLSLVLNGKNYQDVANIIGCTRQAVHQRIERIAHIIKGV